VRSEAVRWTGLGRRFALRCASLLGIGEDVFLLTLPELLQALGGDTSAYARFDERRAVHARYRALPPLPAFILGAFDPFAWAADPDRPADIAVAGVADPPAGALPAEGLVRGAAGSPGVAEGRVRRLDSVADSAGLLAGEVLVTHLTNIGWTPAFPRAAALVTDLGAPLSHATIVAREFGLPAVVGCRDATARLATGDLVRVDGARGLVEVIERAHARDTLEHVFDSAPAQR
jgi:pyruvate,water dikinase